jgi:hypothetical protein
MAQELLCEDDVAGDLMQRVRGRTAQIMKRPGRGETGALEAALEPAVKRARLHGDVRAPLWVHQVLGGIPIAQVERQSVVDVLEGERQLVDVSTFAVNGQRPLLEVYVAEAKAPKFFLAKPEPDEQRERDLVPKRWLGRDQRLEVLPAENVAGLALHLRRLDVYGRIRAQQALAYQPSQETPQDREPLSPRRCRARLPVAIEERPHHSPTPRRLELVESEIGVLDGEQAEDVLVSEKRVEARVGVLERVEIGDDVLA